MSEPLKGAVIRENGGTDEDAVRTEVALRSQVAADEHALSISGAASAGVGLSRLSETDGQEHHRAAGHLSPAVGAGDRPVRRDAASVVPDAAVVRRWLLRVDDDFIWAATEAEARAGLIKSLVEDGDLIYVREVGGEDDGE